MTRSYLLALAISTGPLVWLLSFGADFALSGWICGAQSKVPLYVVSTIAIVLSGAALAIAWREWVLSGKEWPGEAGGPAARTKSVALAGVGINALFIVVVIAQTIPHLMLGGCEEE